MGNGHYRLTATLTWRGYTQKYSEFLFCFNLDEFSCVLLLVTVYQIDNYIFFFYFIVSVNCHPVTEEEEQGGR